MASKGTCKPMPMHEKEKMGGGGHMPKGGGKKK